MWDATGASMSMRCDVDESPIEITTTNASATTDHENTDLSNQHTTTS